MAHLSLTSDRVLSPLSSNTPSSVARLKQLCINVLISPRQPSGLPPLLNHYDWGSGRTSAHPLRDPKALNDIVPSVSTSEATRMLQAINSVVCESHRHQNGISSKQHDRSGDLLPQSHKAPVPDNAAQNPYYWPCPSPQHLEFESTASDGRKSRYLFLHAAEERVEWRDVFGISALPVRYKGCSPGCLSFLDKGEATLDEWSLEG